MTKANNDSVPVVTPAPKHLVRLPGFLIDEDVGLGDVVKHATSYPGVSLVAGVNAGQVR